MDNIERHDNKLDIIRIASQLHAQGINAFQKVHYAQIEPNGDLTVICDEQDMPSVIVMANGEARPDQLEAIEHDKDWLNQQLDTMKVAKEDVFIAEFWRGKLCVIKRDGIVVRSTN